MCIWCSQPSPWWWSHQRRRRRREDGASGSRRRRETTPTGWTSPRNSKEPVEVCMPHQWLIITGWTLQRTSLSSEHARPQNSHFPQSPEKNVPCSCHINVQTRLFQKQAENPCVVFMEVKKCFLNGMRASSHDSPCFRSVIYDMASYILNALEKCWLHGGFILWKWGKAAGISFPDVVGFAIYGH